MERIICIAGPTASGKTSLSIALAKALDGEVVSCAAPKEFFAGNHFYTTSANRLAGQWFPEALTWEEVAAHCEEATMPRR